MQNINFKSTLTLPSQKHSYGTVLFYILMTYVLGFIFRLYLAYDVSQFHPEYFFQDRIIPIWASDAGLYGFYAKQLISGIDLPYDDVHMLGHILYWLHNITGLHIDKIVFYSPAILAPLISIPIILISSLYKYTSIGFFAALLTTVGFNYYFRTHLGYADTDILVYTLTLLIVYTMIAIAEKKDIRFVVIGIISILLLSNVYHSWKPLVTGLVFSYFIYTILFNRKTSVHYVALLFLIISMLGVPLTVKIFLLLLGAIVYRMIVQKNQNWLSYPYPFLVSIGTLFIASLFVGMNKKYYIRIVEYFTKADSFHITDKAGNILEFSGTLQDILEAKGIPFLHSISFISGSLVILIFAIVGLIILISRFRSALLLVPLLFLGMTSFMMGIRFSTFAVPVVSIGIVYFIFLFTYQLQIRNFNQYMVSTLRYSMLLALLAYTAMLSLNYHKVIAPKYTADQAEALYNLSLTASPNDYIISLWDNGWPLWYASGLKTLTHNGKHGPDSFIIAKILTSTNSVQSSNMSRYFLEEYDKFYEKGSIFRRLSKQYDMKKKLRDLTKVEASLPKKTFDIYYYLNDASILKLPTVKKYARIPSKEVLEFTFLAKQKHQTKGRIIGKNFTVNTEKGLINYNNTTKKIGYLIISDGINYKHKKYIENKNVNLNIIVYKNRYMFIVNNYFIQSFAISSFLLNKYNKELFELISITENSKILKLKI